MTKHPAGDALEQPFVRYVENQPSRARDHFRGLREAKQDLVGFFLCDRIDSALKPTPELDEYMWQRREIENYLCQPETLLAYAGAQERDAFGPLFAGPEAERRRKAMEESIADHVIPAAMKDRSDAWWDNVKASEEFLDRVFDAYLKRLDLPRGLFKKSDYHVLAASSPTVPLLRKFIRSLIRLTKQAGEHSHAGRRTRRLQGTELGCRYDRYRKKLIEVALPLGAINQAAARRTAGRAYPNGTTRAGWRFRADDQSGGYDGQSQRWISDAIPTQFQCNSIAISAFREVCYEFRLASDEHQSTPNWRK